MKSAIISNQRQTDRAELQRWLRGIEFHDEDEDGIAEIKLFFKIRDEPEKMERISKELEKNDVIEMLSSFVDANCMPCEGFVDDWRGRGTWGNAGFKVSWYWDEQRQGIVLAANFRT